ncbi:unnamed protein product [Phytomonas sp. Hart1]|nr:unnamed protein product [Phytomonas sp. Hart1]|eukprot:CCW67880.1 unnamed protein product [Phytomonas sp. isolate Hart1]
MPTTASDSRLQQTTPSDSPMPQYGLNTDVVLDVFVRFLIDLAQRLVMSPAERLKVLTAVEGELKRQGRIPSSTGFGGILACIRQVWRREGGLGFLRGVGADLVLSLPAGFVDSLSMTLVSMVVQAVVPRWVSESMGLSTAVAITIGATSLAVMVASPYFALRRSIMTNYLADVVAPPPSRTAAKKGTAVEEKKHPKAMKENSTEENSYLYASAVETTQSIYRRQGLRAFYRGVLVDPILVIIYRGLYIGASMLIPQHLQEAHPYCIVSGLSLASDVTMQPFEVVSRRMILTASDDVHPPYDGMMDCIKSIVREEGTTGLWSGLRCRIAVNFVGLCIRMILGNFFMQQQ